MPDMTNPVEYNATLEQAFLKQSRLLNQSLIALRSAVERLNDLCDPNEEWWQNVDALFEEGLVCDPRSRTHLYDIRESRMTRFKVSIPHALDVQNDLNAQSVADAIRMWAQSCGDDIHNLEGSYTIPCCGHTIVVECVQDQPTSDDPWSLRREFFVYNVTQG